MFHSLDGVGLEEEILWKIARLEESLQSPTTVFHKVYESDGIAVRFAG